MAKKYLFALLCLFIGGGALFALGQKSQKKSDAASIAVIMPNATHGFLGESIRHAQKATKELAEAGAYAYRFLISDDVVEQSNQIDTVVAQGADVVVLWPHNGDELKSAAQTIVDAGIPLIVYDRLISNFNETAELMGDNVKIGEEAGRYFNAYFAKALAAGAVNILEFKGDNSSVPAQRSKGFWSTANANFSAVNEYVTNWSKDTAQTQMETFLSSSPKNVVESIRAVFTHDAEVAAGVLAAIDGYIGNFSLNIALVSAVSAPKELLALFDRYQKLGIEQVTFTYSPAMVADAIRLGISVLQGKPVSGMYLAPTEMVDNGNYKKFQKGAVYTTRYSLD